MTNELELRLECLKMGVQITPSSAIPNVEKILANADTVLNYVTNNGELTFESLKAKETERSIESIIGIVPLFMSLFESISAKPTAEEKPKSAVKTKKQEESL